MSRKQICFLFLNMAHHTHKHSQCQDANFIFSLFSRIYLEIKILMKKGLG